MTPEQLKIQTLERQVVELTKRLDLLNYSSTIPYEVDGAIRDRFELSKLDFKELTDSATSATAQNQPVDEGGTGSYDVLGAPDAFLQVTIDGVTRDIPAYNQ